MDFEPFFRHYEEVVKYVESAFDKVQAEYSDCVHCKIGCADCCHALFDVSLIEALYIKSKFDETFSAKEREKLLERANKADRMIYKIKRNAYKDHQNGKSEEDILVDMAKQRVRCPMLNENDQCDLYDFRPITCRLYGIPTVIGGKGHTCGLSGFEQGKSYPTVRLEEIHKRLYEISFALAHDIKSRYPNLADVLVPLSMALLTDYTMEYLGVQSEEEKSEGAHDGNG
jgi:Fe-S-cluster containining protein